MPQYTVYYYEVTDGSVGTVEGATRRAITVPLTTDDPNNDDLYQGVLGQRPDLTAVLLDGFLRQPD